MGRFKRQQAKQRGGQTIPAARDLPKSPTITMENGSTIRMQTRAGAEFYRGVGGSFSAFDDDAQVFTSTVSATRLRREDKHQRLLRRKILGLILRAICCAALGALSVYAAYRVFVDLTGTN